VNANTREGARGPQSVPSSSSDLALTPNFSSSQDLGVRVMLEK
jgi:hypothetical protein